MVTTSVTLPHFLSLFLSVLLETCHGCCARGGARRRNVPRGPARRSLLRGSSADRSHAAWSVGDASLEGFLFFDKILVAVWCCPPFPRRSGGPAHLGVTSAAPNPHAVWGLVEEGPERERKVCPHRPVGCPQEVLQFEKDGQCFTSTSNWSFILSTSLIYVFTIRLPRFKGLGIFTMFFWVWTMRRRRPRRWSTCWKTASSVPVSFGTMMWVRQSSLLTVFLFLYWL